MFIFIHMCKKENVRSVSNLTKVLKFCFIKLVWTAITLNSNLGDTHIIHSYFFPSGVIRWFLLENPLSTHYCEQKHWTWLKICLLHLLNSNLLIPIFSKDSQRKVGPCFSPSWATAHYDQFHNDIVRIPNVGLFSTKCFKVYFII